MSIPYCICAEIQKTGAISGDKGRYRKNKKTAMPAKGNRDNRSGIMSRPYTYAGKYTSEIQCAAGNGILKREKQSYDI